MLVDHVGIGRRRGILRLRGARRATAVPSLNRPTSQVQQDRRPPQNLEEQVKELEKDVDDALKEEARTICAQRAPYFANVQAACERREYQLLKQRSKERAP